MTNPDLAAAAQLLNLITARWLSAGIAAAAELGVADALADSSKSIEELAPMTGADPSSLHRLLRALASVGVFAEDESHRFRNTPPSMLLRNGPTSLRAMALMTHKKAMTAAWDELVHSVRTGEPAFEHVHGANLFDYFERDPDLAQSFSDAMTARSSVEAQAVIAAVDFSAVSTLVDVGGGHGLLLASILAKNPLQRGILFDLPLVVKGAAPLLERLGVASRCEVAEGSFFEHVPPGADGYVLKHILHDWDDERCLSILKNIHRVARSDARLFVVDAVLAHGNAPHFAKLLDLQMLVSTPGGRERTRPEWDALFARGGFRVARIHETATPFSVLEATRA